ncbi:MAG: Preprotein translocase subunit SecD [Candidatus Woesebacteria bacterium GW2011_GWB1_43_14]|uniref:Protein translocase subunit SecD n=1 Tax=Candidatus Woesebacteria bacterium GW2011_GWB1_43_14 TaxID=1618578 RepID=A0A0G1DI59_9BACT|nr:MAG: Preprotein translocase subunit SecD [Candidatus Woesebacteria bacterium GW2011_GWA1_39_11b]KKS78061.1 MAG: Preprotein translocase subunit SecD [Candidatus Woesebacteria bacterium GW2011_GWC1_42_9]KKS97359.1 MAG: Preprotein translocase subunit SecD [Candidatus Woesebacteria bacterium GW2011_GWB1_43_14]
MRVTLGKKLVLILLLVSVALYVALPPSVNREELRFSLGSWQFRRSFDLSLGLDLVGGSRFVFEIDNESFDLGRREEALESLKNVIERRVNLFGVSEPNIQLSEFEGKSRVIVELPGITDTNQALELIGKTAQLVFATVIEPSVEGGERQIITTELTGADLKSASVGFDQVSGSPNVLIEFTDDGTKKFSILTEENIGKVLPIILDGEVISAPVVNEKITTSTAQISGDFSIEEAKGLAIQLNAGALPVSIKLVEERTVGASLGSQSVEKSVRAGLIGVGIVFVFMIIMYGRLGVVADLGLVIFGVLTIAVYKIIPVVLTLPGIAGFILSVGMAVDANILIFERFREEKNKGVNIIYALETSFGRAWDSIRDANIATLVTAFILANPLDWEFLQTSGPVRGFAITLTIGIAISLFTGVVVSRNLLRLIIRDNTKK